MQEALMQETPMQEAQLLRYSRQILLPEIDIAGQERLAQARVLILGLGGLGSAAAVYLAAAGVGTLVLVDNDLVEISNLQRQVAHGTPDLGRLKVESARDHLLRLNPEVKIKTRPTRLDEENMLAETADVDVVVDGSDNFSTRFAINRACIRTGTPLVCGAAIRFEGQLSVFDTRHAESPCYRCLYSDAHQDRHETCDAIGVAAPVPGVIGALQAMETLKLIVGCGESLLGRLLLYDAQSAQLQTVRLPRDPQCPACGHRPPASTTPSHPPRT